MPLTDYKFWYIKRDDDGFIIEAAVRFYEGNYITETVEGIPQVIYKRIKRLNPGETPHKNMPRKAEVSGKETVLFSQVNFGQIKTDDELRLFMNGELMKDLLRSPINEQK